MPKRLCFILFVFFGVVAAQAQDWKVLFSANGGFYDDVFELEMFSTYPHGHIRYTTNGNRPTAQSPLYEGPLALDERLYSQSDIYTIINCPEEAFYLPDSVQHCIVIRAAVFDENDICVSAVKTNSYFIRALGCDTHGLPVVSLCADSLDLFDYERGILVPGVHYDSLNPYYTGNYFQKGMEWERLANMEFYELDNSGVNQLLGLRTHGQKARWQGQKGLKVYAREEYGEKRIKHRFFDNTPIDSFKRLVMKPFACTWNGNGCADYLCNQMAKDLDVESMNTCPCVLFLNGEYWGIYYIQEKPDERFLEDHLGVDKDHVNIIKNWLLPENGNPENYNAFYAWMEEADLSDEEQYAYAEAHIDIANFIDYYAIELFSKNPDWPATNVLLWQEGNDKWRWIFYDGDGCLQINDYDAFANAIYAGDGGYPSSRRATLFFRRLLENEQFWLQFANRFNELAASVFLFENTKPCFDQIKQTLQGEIPNQIGRFNFPNSCETWSDYCMAVVEQFLREMPMTIIKELQEFLSVNNLKTFDFQCHPNPFHQEIRLCIDAKTKFIDEICIYDLTGRKLFSMPYIFAEGTNEVSVYPNLTAGVYLIRIGKMAHRIVKM